jgi:transglutaminase-like putative cysteine protease
MKIITGSLLLIVLTQTCFAQYYYKDLVTTRQNEVRWSLYKDNRVKSVRLSSFERDGSPAGGFIGDQEVSGDHLTTHTKATGNAESWIIASYTPQGLTGKITDTSDTYRSVSDYQHDTGGRLQSILNTSIETDNHLRDVEQHIWSYDASGKPAAMLKIKNANDTTFVRFVLDEKGNVAEERAVRNKTDLPAIYYYYDTDNRLTDIVRYNGKSKRLLPDNIFEYGDDGKLSSMLVVPDGSNDYLKWLYEYNDKGLKIKESCFGRQKELLGRIEYQYSYK